MYFTLANNSRLQITASTDAVIYSTVNYEQGINPSTGYVADDMTVFATAYNGSLDIKNISLKNTSASTVTSICIYVDNDLLLPCFALEAGQIILIDENGQTYQMVNVSPSCPECDIPQNENLVNIIDRNAASDFSKAHGTVLVGTKLFIGTRNGVLSKLLCYPDYNDLTTFVSIPLPNECFSLCYDSVTQNIYIPINGTKDIVVADANNILSYTTSAVGVTDTFLGGAIVTDNTYLYFGNEGVDGKFIKILISTLAVVAESAWTGSNGTHGGLIDVANGYAIFTSFSGIIAKVPLADITTWTDLVLPYGEITDDICYLPDSDTGYGNLVVCGLEARSGANIGGILVNVDDMSTTYLLDLLPSYGTHYDSVNQRIINTCLEGYIEVISLENLVFYISGTFAKSTYISDVYTFRNISPNELAIASDALLVTSWNSLDGGGNLMRIELSKVENTVMTKVEESYRSGSSSSSGGTSWTDVIVTDANFTAADDTRYYLASGVLTANRDVNMSAVTTKVMFVVSQDASEFYLNFTGATVYNRGGSDTITSVLGLWTSVIEKVDSKLIQTQ